MEPRLPSSRPAEAKVREQRAQSNLLTTIFVGLNSFCARFGQTHSQAARPPSQFLLWRSLTTLSIRSDDANRPCHPAPRHDRILARVAPLVRVPGIAARDARPGRRDGTSPRTHVRSHLRAHLRSDLRPHRRTRARPSHLRADLRADVRSHRKPLRRHVLRGKAMQCRRNHVGAWRSRGRRTPGTRATAEESVFR